ncbi:Asparagine synthetase domain-containing protein OS=Streptomyces glaucescens OX=1907 GN=SGLAU_16140 PE=4 SV=1 [Streptomyces glaucescens]
MVTGGEETLPYAELDGPLTDEPSSCLVPPPGTVPGSPRQRRPPAGYGAQVLDAHPARLADLLMDRQRRHLVRPVAALAKADGSVLVPARVYAAARRLARTPYRAGVENLAGQLMERCSRNPEAPPGRPRGAHLGQTRSRRALADRGGTR